MHHEVHIEAWQPAAVLSRTLGVPEQRIHVAAARVTCVFAWFIWQRDRIEGEWPDCDGRTTRLFRADYFPDPNSPSELRVKALVAMRQRIERELHGLDLAKLVRVQRLNLVELELSQPLGRSRPSRLSTESQQAIPGVL